MSEPRAIPEKVFASSPESQLAYFDKVTIAHPVLIEVDAALRAALRRPGRGTLVMVFGPAGAGKTTLLTRIEQWLVEQAMPDLRADPDRIAAVRLEAVVEGQPSFNWRDYYLRALMALDECLVDRKLDLGSRVGRPIHELRRIGRRNATAADLRYALERALLFRRPAACLVDEAHHFAKIATGRRLVDQMDAIKSLANLTNVVHVLVGSYGLLDMANLSGQLSRRTVMVHFRRYRADSDTDVHAFRRAIWTFQRHIPLAEEPDLLGRWEYLMVNTSGCIGNLKDWLRRAFAAASREGAERLEDRHLDEAALAPSQCRSIAAEAWDGEQRVAASADASAELRQLVGFDTASLRAPATAGPPKPTRPTRPRLPGRRRPARDGVGSEAATS